METLKDAESGVLTADLCRKILDADRERLRLARDDT